MSVVDHDKKSSIHKTAAAKNVFEPYQRTEKLVFARFQNQYVKQSYQLKVVNYVDVMAVIHVISMINTSILQRSIQIMM